MAKGSNQKYKLLYLLLIMLENTDGTHYLTMPEIIGRLAEYEVSAERKSIYDDLNDLEKYGVTVESEKMGRYTGYHVVKRPFELAELKLLVDSIQSTKFLTLKKSNDLIKKLENFCSKYEKNQLQRQVYVQNRIKTMNETVYYTVDAINEAISDNKKIRFKYFNWNINKEMEFRHGGNYYEISPWALSYDDENYYLIGFDGEKVKHYRVDKMKSLSVMSVERDGGKNFVNFDAADYAKKNFSMYGGEEELVTLKISNDMAGVMIDRFGKDVRFVPCNENESLVRINVAISLHFITWVWALGDKVKIVGPDSLVDIVKNELQRISKQYEEA